jgi:RNA polymerase sigma-70 factor (ECF subfamily)
MDEHASELERLYAEAGPDVWRYLRRRTADRDSAEELMQETFLAAAGNLQALRAAVSKRAWLVGIARNLTREHWRARRRSRQVEFPEREAVAKSTPPDQGVEAVRQAIGTLPDGQGEVLELRLIEDLSYAKIAEALDIPIGTVRSRIHHAIRVLRESAILARSREQRQERPVDLQRRPR